MLNKTYRGLANQEVSSLFQNRNTPTKANAAFRVLAISTPSNRSQFSLIIPKKLIKSAVFRNRLRRQLSEDIRQVYSYWTVGRRVAILVKRGVLELDTVQRRASLSHLLEELHQTLITL